MKIAIVEDQPIYRAIFRKICEQDLGFCVVGEAGTAAKGVALVADVEPDALILDIGLSDTDGFAVARAAAKRRVPPRLLVVSGHLTEYVLQQCEFHGVHAFVDKGTNTVAAVRTALLAVVRNQTYYSTAFQTARRHWRADGAAITKHLSPTEQEVLGWIARGLSDVEIAARMATAESTAKGHCSSILRRLDIDSTPKLMTFAENHGFGQIK